MTTTKKSYGFRLSAQAEQHLNRIIAVTGITKTAAVECALAQMAAALKGENMAQNAHNRRSALNNRMAALELGDYSDTYSMTDDAFESLVIELEAAQKAGEINLETNAGVDRLAEIYKRHVYQS